MTQKTVLVCDDNDAYRNTLLAALESFDLRGVGASTAKEALALAEVEPFDLAILDVIMPTQGGITLAHDLHDRFPDLPIIICSGKDAVFRSPIVSSGLSFVKARFPKTIDLLELEEIVSRVLEGSED